MEHDSTCERISIARAVTNKIQLSTSEFERLVRAEVEERLCCNCYYRAEDSPTWRKLDLKDRVISFVLDARFKESEKTGNAVTIPAGAEMVIISEEGSGDIILVDFQNRRRLR